MPDPEWPEDFNEDEVIASALADDADVSTLTPVDDEEQIALATGIISHQLRKGVKGSNGRLYAVDNSSFRTPATEQYQVRVALYNRAGARVYLGPFRAKGGGAANRTLLHTENVMDDGQLTHRALVLWRMTNGGDVWTNWTQ